VSAAAAAARAVVAVASTESAASAFLSQHLNGDAGGVPAGITVHPVG